MSPHLLLLQPPPPGCTQALRAPFPPHRRVPRASLIFPCLDSCGSLYSGPCHPSCERQPPRAPAEGGPFPWTPRPCRQQHKGLTVGQAHKASSLQPPGSRLQFRQASRGPADGCARKHCSLPTPWSPPPYGSVFFLPSEGPLSSSLAPSAVMAFSSDDPAPTAPNLLRPPPESQGCVCLFGCMCVLSPWKRVSSRGERDLALTPPYALQHP